MHSAIVYYDHYKFAIIYYNESDGDWQVSFDALFQQTTDSNIYTSIRYEFLSLLYDFYQYTENYEDFNFSEFICNYDSNLFYMVEMV